MVSVFYPVLGLLIFLRVDQVTGCGPKWPVGKYGLLKPRAGCPLGWEDNGFLFQDTVDVNPSNKRSDILHIHGQVAPSYVMQSFCVKAKSKTGKKDWPKGQYCIYRHANWTLPGMESGWIGMHDEKTNNKDAEFTHSLVTIETKRKEQSMERIYDFTKMRFYCMITNVNKTTPIELPIYKPFYLLPYGSSECQQVKWMVATTEWIKYHTRDYQGYHQKNGTVPYYEIGDSENKTGIKMYYCYYQSCNHTLKEKKGVFQSPGFPHKYPDGQLCSWRIMVPANHTIHVHFTNFSLYGNDDKDTLKYSKKTNGSFGPHYMLYGDILPTLTSKSDLEFVFSSDEKNSNTGFRAEYNISISSDSMNTSTPLTKKINMKKKKPLTNINAKPTLQTTPGHHMSNRHTTTISCEKTWTNVFIMIPLVCLILIIVIVIDVVYRFRSGQSSCVKCEPRQDAKKNNIYWMDKFRSFRRATK